MDVVAQWVRTSWTKRSRGGPEATRRNAAPVAFVLPAARCPLVHEIQMDESDDFEPLISVADAPPDRSGVLLTEADGRLRVQVVHSAWGAPRNRRRGPVVRLSPGEWVRWQVNYRFSGYHGWSYRLDTLNLSYGPVAVDTVLGPPLHHVDDRAELF